MYVHPEHALLIHRTRHQYLEDQANTARLARDLRAPRRGASYRVRSSVANQLHNLSQVVAPTGP